MNDIAQRIASLSPEQKALLEQRMRTASPRVLAAAQSPAPIAVIGVGCRLPGGVAGPDDYWRMLRDGIDAITEVPAERWDNARLYDPEPDAKGCISTPYGGFVADVDRSDWGLASHRIEASFVQHCLPFLRIVPQLAHGFRIALHDVKRGD